MNDVKDMLAAALDRGPDPGQPVNPAGDLARGRRLLRRRRLTRLAGAAGVAGVAAGIVAAVLTLGPAGQSAPHQPPAAGQHTRHQHAPPAPAGQVTSGVHGLARAGAAVQGRRQRVLHVVH